MRASRFLYMLGGALITAGLVNLHLEPGFILLVVGGIIGTFIASRLDRYDD